MTTDQKEAIAELAIARARRSGLASMSIVLVAEGGRYDLIFEIGERLWRVQC